MVLDVGGRNVEQAVFHSCAALNPPKPFRPTSNGTTRWRLCTYTPDQSTEFAVVRMESIARYSCN